MEHNENIDINKLTTSKLIISQVSILNNLKKKRKKDIAS